MKTILSTLILSFVLMSGSAQKMAISKINQDEKSTVFNYVVMTKKVDQLEPILLAALHLLKEDERHFGNFEVIVCGKDIVSLTDEEKMNEFLKRAEEYKVQILACGFSLKKFEVEPEKIPGNIKIVENGILHNLELQKKGYLSLEL